MARPRHGSFPSTRSSFPGTTTLLEAEQIDDTRETDAHVQKIFTGRGRASARKYKVAFTRRIRRAR